MPLPLYCTAFPILEVSNFLEEESYHFCIIGCSIIVVLLYATNDDTLEHV